MDPKYSDFAEKNPTLQNRIEALTSGILTPDTKAITLWSMEPDKFYSASELYSRVKNFAGGSFPVTMLVPWEYCNGRLDNTSEGSLYKIGAVVKAEIEIANLATGPSTTIKYAKTQAGKDFGDALAARASKLSTKLNSKYKSMLRVFGGAQKPKDAKLRMGFVVYKIIKFLIENKKRQYRATDISEKTGFSLSYISDALNSLGDNGIIDYESPAKDISGKRAQGWAKYKLINKDFLNKSFEEIYHEINKKYNKSSKTKLKDILECIKTNPTETYSIKLFSSKSKHEELKASSILSFLANKGCLSFDFSGSKILTKTKMNENTHLLWKYLLEPIEIIAERLDPTDYKGFYSCLEYYNTDQVIRTNHIQNLLNQYNQERNSRGIEGSNEINDILITIPKKIIKRSEIIEFLNKKRKISLKRSSIHLHLTKLVNAGKFKKIKRGYYQKI